MTLDERDRGRGRQRASAFGAALGARWKAGPSGPGHGGGRGRGARGASAGRGPGGSPGGRARRAEPVIPSESPGGAAASRYRRALWPVLGSVVLIGILFLAVFPTRTYLAQRQSISAGQKRLRVIEEQNAKLEERVKALDTDAEIERLAREQYNLVRPGEESYAILPVPSPTVTIPDLWPFENLHERLLGRPATPPAETDDPAKSEPAEATGATTAASGQAKPDSD